MLGVVPALVLASCAPGADLRPLPPETARGYRLGVGDQVRVITFGEEQLTGQFDVNDAGAIAVPLVGLVQAQGLTTAELGTRLADLLKKKHLIRNPSVSVEIVRYRPIFILGEVRRPGEYRYQPGMTVLTAVAVAGGFTYRAVETYAAILRASATPPVEGRVPRTALVEPGDVITIFERHF